MADPCTFFLEHARVALNDGEAFGPGGDGFVLAGGLSRMRDVLDHALEAR